MSGSPKISPSSNTTVSTAAMTASTASISALTTSTKSFLGDNFIKNLIYGNEEGYETYKEKIIAKITPIAAKAKIVETKDTEAKLELLTAVEEAKKEAVVNANTKAEEVVKLERTKKPQGRFSRLTGISMFNKNNSETEAAKAAEEAEKAAENADAYNEDGSFRNSTWGGKTANLSNEIIRLSYAEPIDEDTIKVDVSDLKGKLCELFDLKFDLKNEIDDIGDLTQSQGYDDEPKSVCRQINKEDFLDIFRMLLSYDTIFDEIEIKNKEGLKEVVMNMIDDLEFEGEETEEQMEQRMDQRIEEEIYIKNDYKEEFQKKNEEKKSFTPEEIQKLIDDAVTEKTPLVTELSGIQLEEEESEEMIEAKEKAKAMEEKRNKMENDVSIDTNIDTILQKYPQELTQPEKDLLKKYFEILDSYYGTEICPITSDITSSDWTQVDEKYQTAITLEIPSQ